MGGCSGTRRARVALLARLLSLSLAGAAAFAAPRQQGVQPGDEDSRAEQNGESGARAPSSASEGAAPTARADAERLREARRQLSERGSFTDLRIVLEELAVRHPETMALTEIGRSAGDRPVLLVRVGPEAPERPSLLLCPELSGPLFALQAVEWLEALLAAPGARERGPVWILPAPDPDRMRAPTSEAERAPELGAEEPPAPARPEAQAPLVGLDQDFPIGWQPRASGSALPFERVESRLLADTLLAHDELALVVLIGEAGRTEALLPGPASDRIELPEALARIGGVLLPGAKSAAPGGSLAAFCAGRLALPVLGLERGLSAAAALNAIDELRLGLPRLELELVGARSIGDGVWQVEFSVRNAGALGTAGSCRAALPREEVRATVSGAELDFAALRPLASSEFALIESRAGGVSLGSMAGGDIYWVRFYVQASHGSALELGCSAPRAGSSSSRLILGE